MGEKIARAAGVIGGLAGFVLVLHETGEVAAAIVAGILAYVIAAAAGRVLWAIVVAAAMLLVTANRVMTVARVADAFVESNRTAVAPAPAPPAFQPWSQPPAPVPNTWNPPPAAPPPVTVPAPRELQFANGCRRSIQLWVRYRRPGGGWITDGVWSISGGDTTFLASQTNTRIRLGSADVQYYAEVPDADYAWHGTHPATHNGRRLPMRSATLSTHPGGFYQLGLDCENFDTAAGTPVHVVNRCASEVRFWLRYRDPNGAWSQLGPWQLRAHEGPVSLSRAGDRPLRKGLGDLLYYAESTDGRWKWEGDRAVTFGTRALAMRAWTPERDESGNSVIPLTCRAD